MAGGQVLARAPENQRLISETGGIALIVASMHLHPDHVGVQRESCGALRFSSHTIRIFESQLAHKIVNLLF